MSLEIDGGAILKQSSVMTGPTVVNPNTKSTSSHSPLRSGDEYELKPKKSHKRKSRTSPRSSVTTKDALKKIRHRERCRVNQELYRKRQHKLTQTLEDKIQALQNEVRARTRQSREFLATPATQSIWVVVTQYFHHYQNFILAPVTARDTVRDFMHATMAPEVVYGPLGGVEALLESWTLFSHYFDRIRLTLASLHPVDASTVAASTIISLTISESSIVDAFPNLSSKAEDKQIAAKLRGQRVVMTGTVRFYWNSSSNRVVRVLNQADMLSPLLSLLGSLDEVSRVFENARVTPDWNLVPIR
ncbi:hypothetical protein PHYPSEUDO_014117 [Phytophthora pseudosyringae]|uniref:BZIP transcription factor 1 n=1 Tax=Phytophthora pseudosyringae TaxID=221518 RepID=A0A8T1W6R1_9STRA|nr:hypothetical protein PHYPSEUDO_014117 [Phytophthora pseudosyringae]